MKALVLENGLEIDIPKDLIKYLKKNKIEWKWFDMRERFWPENKAKTIKLFSELPKGQVLICDTVFDGYQQLELMIQLLHKLKDKEFIFKIIHPCLPNSLIKFYEEEESSITPKELTNKLESDEDLTDKQLDKIYEEIYSFKKEINHKFIEVLEYHNIIWLDEEIELKSLDIIKENTF